MTFREQGFLILVVAAGFFLILGSMINRNNPNQAPLTPASAGDRIERAIDQIITTKGG